MKARLMLITTLIDLYLGPSSWKLQQECTCSAEKHKPLYGWPIASKNIFPCLFLLIGRSFQACSWWLLPWGVCLALGDVEWSKPTGEGKNKPGYQTGFKGQNLAGFVTEFNLNKSEYDSGFRPWGETLGCV